MLGPWVRHRRSQGPRRARITRHQGARVVAHTPLDRPASGRVLEKAGFTNTGVVDDEDDGSVVTVLRWEQST